MGKSKDIPVPLSSLRVNPGERGVVAHVCHPQAESGVPKHSQLLGEFKATVWGVGGGGLGVL